MHVVNLRSPFGPVGLIVWTLVDMFSESCICAFAA
jgi:hypothetical protein